MPKFVRRTILGDIPRNDYYNLPTFVGSGGYYNGNNNYQCVNYAVGRGSEIAEAKIVYFPSQGDTKESCVYPAFKRVGYGNAAEMWNDTLWRKTIYADEVKRGDWVIYGSGWGYGCGHIRVVEDIEDNCFVCSGGNEDGNHSCKFNIRINKLNGGGDGATGLVGYIHNPYITDEEVPKEPDYKALYLEAKAKLDMIQEVLNG